MLTNIFSDESAFYRYIICLA